MGRVEYLADKEEKRLILSPLNTHYRKQTTKSLLCPSTHLHILQPNTKFFIPQLQTHIKRETLLHSKDIFPSQHTSHPTKSQKTIQLNDFAQG